MEQSITLDHFDTAVVAMMTRDEAAASEQRILSLTTDLRAELLRFYEGRGWDALGYSSWRAWASARLGQAERTAYQELVAGQIERELLRHGANEDQEFGTIPERQLRPLTPLRDDTDLIRDTWDRAHEIAEERGEKFTARHVTAAVQEVTAPEVYPVATEVVTPDPIPMAVHFSSATPEWYTPAHIIALAHEVMGGIDLDPASCAEANATIGAVEWYGLDHPSTARRDGLAHEWHGRVWMNPPYGDEIGAWTQRLKHQHETGHAYEAIALLPARSDTAWFQEVTAGRSVCFVRGRLRFSGAENSAPFPSAIVYFGENIGRFHMTFGRIGVLATFAFPQSHA